MWRIGRKKKPQSLSPDEPESIFIYDTSYEDVINKILEMAAAKARNVQQGETFKVVIDPAEIPWEAHYIEIVGPVMIRAGAYGLDAGACFDWSFEFTKR